MFDNIHKIQSSRTTFVWIMQEYETAHTLLRAYPNERHHINSKFVAHIVLSYYYCELHFGASSMDNEYRPYRMPK
jgi:hypothetical protein